MSYGIEEVDRAFVLSEIKRLVLNSKFTLSEDGQTVLITPFGFTKPIAIIELKR